MATYLVYKDVVPDVESLTTATFTGAYSASSSALALTGQSNDITSLEHNFWVSGAKRVAPDNFVFPFVSNEISDANGNLSSVAMIRLDFSAGITSAGITLNMAGGRASEVEIKWYRDNVVTVDETFYPDADEFIIERGVSDYDAVEIIFKSTTIPQRRVRCNSVILGIIRRLGMAVLQDVDITAETDLAGQTLPISTLKWTVTTRDAQLFTFQSKQPVQAFHNNTLIGEYYLETSERLTEKTYTINCTDAFGVLDGEPFNGGFYSGVSARTLASQILDGMFTLTEIGDIEDVLVSGVILAGTKRTALQQLFFAWGVIPVSDRNAGISIVSLSTSSLMLGADRTMPDVSVKVENTVTEIKLTAHSYVQDANGSVTINGVKYADTPIVHSLANPNATSFDQTNIKEITDATLINSSNVDDALERLYQYYLRRSVVSAEIVWKDDVWLGDYVTQLSGWGTGLMAYIEKMSYALSNTILVKCESRSTGDSGIIVGDFFRSAEVRTGEVNA